MAPLKNNNKKKRLCSVAAIKITTKKIQLHTTKQIFDMFKYVFIPCSESNPIETQEESKAGGLSDDYLAKRAKEYFHQKSNGAARAKALDEATSEQRKQIAQNVRNQYMKSDNASVRAQIEKMDDEMLLSLVKASEASATCEITALTVPTALNSYRGVSMYGDDNAKDRDLPFNKRATELLTACGHQSNNVHGDVFVGRYHDNEVEDIWERVDFTEDELKGDLVSQDWIQTAREKGGGGGLGTAAASLSGMMSGQSQETKEKTYTWSQTEDEVEMKFAVAPGTKAKYCKVKFGAKTLKISVAGQTLCDGKTFGTVAVDESTYTIQDNDSGSGRELCISLGKKTNEHWTYAVNHA